MTPASVTHLDTVRGDLGLDHLPPADLDVQRNVLVAVSAVAERQPVELGVDVDGGARRVVLAGAPVHAGALRLVGQPGPTALDGRVGGDGERLLDGGLVADRCVELDDDRRRDPDGLAVGQLEAAADLLGGRHGGELALDRNRLAVVADGRPAPGVGRVVAQRLGDRVDGAVLVERAGNDLARRIRQRDVLEPAVADLDADRRDRYHVGGRIGRLERQVGRWRRLLDRLRDRFARAGGQDARREHPDPKRRQSQAPIDRPLSLRGAGCAHDTQRYRANGPETPVAPPQGVVPRCFRTKIAATTRTQPARVRV